MIKLDVQDYCQDCPNFKADVEMPVELYNGFGIKPVYFGDTIIRCKHKDLCERVELVVKGGKE